MRSEVGGAGVSEPDEREKAIAAYMDGLADGGLPFRAWHREGFTDGWDAREVRVQSLTDLLTGWALGEWDWRPGEPLPDCDLEDYERAIFDALDAALPVPVAETHDYKLSERCEASLVGQRCELPAGHAGRHQVEHGEKRGRYHRWESPVPVEGACTHSQRTGDGSGHWQCDLCGVEGWGAEVFDGKPCPEHRWMGRVAGTRAPCPHCPVEGEAATPDCSQSVQGLGTTGEGDADR